MARDYEDIQNLDQLDDREIRDLVRERLAEHNGIDVDDIVVDVQNGAIALTGRVGTESEHLADDADSDLAGTTDVQDAIEGAKSWNPPESPTQEGMSGTDAAPEDYGEQH